MAPCADENGGSLASAFSYFAPFIPDPTRGAGQGVGGRAVSCSLQMQELRQR